MSSRKRDWVREYAKHFDGMHAFHDFLQEQDWIDKKTKLVVMQAMVEGLIVPHMKSKELRNPPISLQAIVSRERAA